MTATNILDNKKNRQNINSDGFKNMIYVNYTCNALLSVAAKAASFTASAKVGCA